MRDHPCRLVAISRSAYRYQAKRPDDTAIREQLTALAERHRRWGFDKMMGWLRQHGFIAQQHAVS